MSRSQNRECVTGALAERDTIELSKMHRYLGLEDNVWHQDVRVFDQKMPESHTADQPMTPRGRAKERYRWHDIQKTTKVKPPALSSETRPVTHPSIHPSVLRERQHLNKSSCLRPKWLVCIIILNTSNTIVHMPQSQKRPSPGDHIFTNVEIGKMKKVNKQCLLDTPRTVRVSEKTWQVIVQTSRP